MVKRFLLLMCCGLTCKAAKHHSHLFTPFSQWDGGGPKKKKERKQVELVG